MRVSVCGPGAPPLPQVAPNLDVLTWNEEFSLPVINNQVEAMVVECWDSSNGVVTCLGNAAVDLDKLVRGEPMDTWARFPHAGEVCGERRGGGGRMRRGGACFGLATHST